MTNISNDDILDGNFAMFIEHWTKQPVVDKQGKTVIWPEVYQLHVNKELKYPIQPNKLEIIFQIADRLGHSKLRTLLGGLLMFLEEIYELNNQEDYSDLSAVIFNNIDAFIADLKEFTCKKINNE